jgi:hypothetical protein
VARERAWWQPRVGQGQPRVHEIFSLVGMERGSCAVLAAGRAIAGPTCQHAPSMDDDDDTVLTHVFKRSKDI